MKLKPHEIKKGQKDKKSYRQSNLYILDPSKINKEPPATHLRQRQKQSKNLSICLTVKRGPGIT